LRRDDVPWLLRDDEDADAEAGHDVNGFRRHRGRVRATAEGLEGSGPEGRSRLLHELAVVGAVAVLEAAEDHLRALHEAAPRLLHRDAKPGELDPTEATPETQGGPPAAHVVGPAP